MLISLLKQQRFFLLPYAGLWLLGLVFSLLNGRYEGHLILNRFVFDAINIPMGIITHLGDGLTLTLLAIALLLYKFRAALFLAASGALAGGVTQLLKNYAFPDIDRPFQYFKYYDATRRSLHLALPETEMHIHHSFPSGHATTSFCLFLALSVIMQRRGWSVFWLLCAVVVSYSRVYLSQHFLEDILAGSVIAVVSTLTMAAIFKYHLNDSTSSQLEKSLLRWRD